MRIVVTGAAGYVGSALMEALERAGEVAEGVDRRGWKAGYETLNRVGFFYDFDVVIHLAAHSSVKECENAREIAWENNVTNFYALLRNMNPRSTLIYASSASVYNGLPGASAEDAALLPPIALYDATKRTMDDLARLSGLRAYGLRFGTVNGPSPQMRPELILNAMTRSAIDRGHVTVTNPQARRSIAGIGDVVGAILHLMDGKAAPGVYNVASAHNTMEGFGREVAALCDVPVVIDPQPTPCYDFHAATAKLEATGWAPRQTTATIVRALMEEVAA